MNRTFGTFFELPRLFLLWGGWMSWQGLGNLNRLNYTTIRGVYTWAIELGDES